MRFIQYVVLVVILAMSHQVYADGKLRQVEPKDLPAAVIILVPPTVLDSLRIFLHPGESPDTLDDFAHV